MSQFGLPYPNDNILEQGIEWDSISNRKWKRGSKMNKRGFRRIKLFVYLGIPKE